jgi:hypothetical protein
MDSVLNNSAASEDVAAALRIIMLYIGNIIDRYKGPAETLFLVQLVEASLLEANSASCRVFFVLMFDLATEHVNFLLFPRSPGEDKFRSIRSGNAAFQKRVASIKGGIELLQRYAFLTKS